MAGSIQSKVTYILIGYLIALLMSFLVLNLVTDKKCFLTRIGDRTLTIYLFHVFVAKAIKRIKILHELNHFILFLLLIILTIAITYILASELFIKISFYLCNPLRLLEKLKDTINKRVKKSV